MFYIDYDSTDCQKQKLCVNTKTVLRDDIHQQANTMPGWLLHLIMSSTDKVFQMNTTLPAAPKRLLQPKFQEKAF